MKTKITTIVTIACLFMSVATHAQLTPQPSSTQTISQGFGLGKITLIYSRPNVKGRIIFGATEPYDKVWRTGANAATVIKFSDDVSMNGHLVPAGEYSLFSIPGRDKWVIILSKKPNQWGAYSYQQSDDYLRFDVKPETLPAKIETFTMQFTDVYPLSADLQLMWEHTGLTIHLTCDVDAKVMAKIDSAMQTDKKPYYDAVIYYWNNNKDMNKALVWANEMQTMQGLPPMVAKLWKARVLLKKGDKAEAITTATEGVKLAEAAKSDEYARLNKEVIAAATK